MAKKVLVSDENPYSFGYIIELAEGKQILKRDKLVYEFAVARDLTHTIIEGETLYDIAFRWYGNSKLWWVIADANQVFNPFELTPGNDLFIPDLDKIKLQL